MLRRVLIFALVCWGVLAVPSLCSAGVLEHVCACGVSNNCSHEESCSADPCVIGKPSTDSVGMIQTLAPTHAILIFPIAGPMDSGTRDAWKSSRYPAFALPPALRFGARPLLI